MTLMRNPLQFKKRYILKIYDDNYSPSAVVGQACHKAVEQYLRGVAITDAIEQGMKHIESISDVAIDYGKTGSREKMLKDYTKGIQSYFDERPQWEKRKILGIEDRMTEVIYDDTGTELPLPAKCFVDALWESTRPEVFADKEYPTGSLFIEDHKFVASYSDPHDDDPARLVQSMFNYHIVKSKTGIAPAAILYRETKFSKNADGSPQSQYLVIDFDKNRHYFPIFYNLYRDFTAYLMQPNVIFLPNFTDIFDGKNSYDTYRQNIIGVDTPMQVVPKKTKDVQFIDKSFTPSAVDKIENKDLTPSERIRLKLLEFGIPVEMGEEFSSGSVTMYTMKPSRGVRLSAIESHTKDLALALKAKSVRIQAPIAGTSLVGVEVPNEDRKVINYTYDETRDGTMLIPIGQDVYGKRIEKDLRDMPHLLVAGTTGSGKSVMLSVILKALTEQMSDADMKLVLIDPKRVELKAFEDAPHLLTRVIYDHEPAMRALKWLVDEMEERYKILENVGAKNIASYTGGDMPYVVCVIDEFADLMLETRNGFTEYSFCSQHSPYNRKGELERLMHTKTKRRKKEQELVEEVHECCKLEGEDTCEENSYPSAELMIVRLAQKARAVGIHLVIATQRPTVDVVTGLIKANMPTRIAFAVPAKNDSITIIDRVGAEVLVGRGDMLWIDPASKEVQRLQGYFTT